MIESGKGQRWLVIGLTALTILIGGGSILAGETAISAGEVFDLILSGAWGEEGNAKALIIFEIRLPRILLAGLIGCTLGLCGAALQGLLRNPLADPGLIGVSASASLGAVIAMYFGLATVFPMALPLGGMLGALLSVGAIYLLAGRDASVLTLILVGVAINSLAGALTSLALNLAPSPFAALEIVFWLLGSVQDRSLDHVALAIPLMLFGWALLIGLGRPLDALTLGEDTAQSLGFNLPLVRLRVILAVAFSVGAATAVAGAIGFVGLVVPHLLRPLVGYRPGKLLVVSGLGGAIMLLTADLLVRLLPTQSDIELKLGVLTAMVGAPFFLSLILSTRKTMR